MNSYLFADRLLQHGLNAILIFCVFTILVSILLKIFNIKNHRLRSCVRLIPIFRLALYPLFSWIPSKISLINLNLFSCSHPLQELFYKKLSPAIKEELSSHNLTTLTGWIISYFSKTIIIFCIAAVLATSFLKLIVLVVRYLYSIQSLRRVLKGSTLNSQPINNKYLISLLDKHKIKIRISDEIDSPLATFGNNILIPKNLQKQLTSQEFESIIFHEIEHLRWKEISVRIFVQVVLTIFWWVPSKAYFHKLEQEQEIACDESIKHYKSDSLSLATALQKAAQYKTTPDYSHATFAKAKPKLLIKRVALALSPYNQQNKFTGTLALLSTILLTFTIGFAVC